MTKTAVIPDQDALRRVGKSVREKLEDNPRVHRVPNDKVEIYAISDFLSVEECQKLIHMTDVVAQPSVLYDRDYDSGFRTSYSGNYNPNDPLVRTVSDRMDKLLGIRKENGEYIQGQRYMPGQQFKPHNDWFYTDQPYWKGERKRGGQRSWTAMAFLNNVEEGGATHFTHAGIKIQPKCGVLLTWNNALEDGSPNPDTMHAGTPVVRGVKYVLTKWYRTRKWS
ncbi:2OG-Fe(II) oxygenase [Qipengyuania sp. JC766]|uniref:2OG-Fe(II) oxygenase n=1 Tax=Qipengyuania sp. JC766 TaxID=3232139 RepID=UPI003458E2CF